MNDLKIFLDIVATPIGNINEITFHAIESLKNSDIVVCENILRTKKIFYKYNLLTNKKFFRCNASTEELAFKAVEKYLKTFKKKEAINICLTSNAGYPLISDPGWYFLRKLKEKFNISTTVSNGPCSINHALLLSGFNINSFFFFGFLPKKTSELNKKIQIIKDLPTLIVFFLSKHRLKKELTNLLSFFEKKEASLAFELSKVNEKVINGKISELLNKISDDVKGEIVLTINNN
ncbi:hypothetical protein JTY60_00520 [symbiont of Argiope bruennichi]|uniref:SAM-dependent methyltransferase n=1 Tax=symbiont of Argiope bruennichi TaxID=2810479 RepID=UPI003DA6BF99